MRRTTKALATAALGLALALGAAPAAHASELDGAAGEAAQQQGPIGEAPQDARAEEATGATDGDAALPDEADGAPDRTDEPEGREGPEAGDEGAPQDAPQPQPALQASDDGEGLAYAVFDEDTGALTLVRSHDELADGAGQTITDTCGNAHTGHVFGGIEGLRAESAADVPWFAAGLSLRVTSLSVAPGCTVRPASCAWWLCGAASLSTADLAGLDTRATTSFAHMFDGCRSLTTLDARPLATGSARFFDGMFASCESLRSLDLSTFDMWDATSAEGMFRRCPRLARLSLGMDFFFLPGETVDNSLPAPPADGTHTGMWANEGDPTQCYPAAYVALRYQGFRMAGTWSWETYRDWPLALDLGNGMQPDGEAYQTSYRTAEALALPGTDGSPLAAPVWEGHQFSYWADEDGALAERIEPTSRGPRALHAVWDEPQLRVRFPADVTFLATHEQDGTVTLSLEEGDFSLAIQNTGTSAVDVTATADACYGYKVGYEGVDLMDREFEVWMTPVTCGAWPKDPGYDPQADAGYEEHARLLASRLWFGEQPVGPTLGPGETMWLNDVGGTMGGWGGDVGARERLGTVSWTFRTADGS